MDADAQKADTWNRDHLTQAIMAGGVGRYAWNVDTDRLILDDQSCALWGQSVRGEVTFEDLSARIHPRDLDRVRAAFAATRAIMGPFEIDFRILLDGLVRWICARGQGDDADIERRVMYGIFLDVTGRKQAEESHELLAGEMGHRVKNLLGIATALTKIASRTSTTKVEMARELTDRLIALGRAHSLVHIGRAKAGTPPPQALLGDLLSILLAPYEDLGAFEGRIRVSVPRINVGKGATTALALVIHELATNSVKHGALAIETGLLDVACSDDGGEIVLVWTERGGPPVRPVEATAGQGSEMIEMSMTHQLGGGIDYEWSRQGLIATLRIDAGRLGQ